jgi:hypothetical protein
MGSLRKAVKPKQFMSPFLSIFDGEFHWERKMRIRSLYESFPEFKDEVGKHLPLLYDHVYGWEFFPADTFLNIEDVGVSPSYPLIRGYNKLYKVCRLQTPRDSITDNLVYSTPFFTEWKRGESKEFSVRRKQTYRQTRYASSEHFEYNNPRVVLNKSKKPGMSIVQNSVSDMYDMRLIAKYGLSLGKVTYNLFGDSLFKALIQCSYASNPFEAYATGGYTILTPWRRLPTISSEMLDLVNSLYWHVDRVYHHMTKRFDMDKMDLSNLFPGVRKPKRQLTTTPPPEFQESRTEDDPDREPRGSKRLMLDKVQIVNDFNIKSSTIISGLDMMTDIHSRFEDIEDPFLLNEEEGEYDFHLGDLEEVEEGFYDI